MKVMTAANWGAALLMVLDGHSLTAACCFGVAVYLTILVIEEWHER